MENICENQVWECDDGNLYIVISRGITNSPKVYAKLVCSDKEIFLEDIDKKGNFTNSTSKKKLTKLVHETYYKQDEKISKVDFAVDQVWQGSDKNFYKIEHIEKNYIPYFYDEPPVLLQPHLIIRRVDTGKAYRVSINGVFGKLHQCSYRTLLQYAAECVKFFYNRDKTFNLVLWYTSEICSVEKLDSCNEITGVVSKTEVDSTILEKDETHTSATSESLKKDFISAYSKGIEIKAKEFNIKEFSIKAQINDTKSTHNDKNGKILISAMKRVEDNIYMQPPYSSLRKK